MKIIYIPIVIPVNYRTIFSLMASVVALVLLIFACQSKQWNVCRLIPKVSTTEAGTSVDIYQSLQSIDITICSPTWGQGQGQGRPPLYLCELRHVIFRECDTVADSWCQGGQKFTGGFASLIAGILLVFFALAVGFLREMMLGPLLLLAGVVQVLVLTLYSAGISMAMNAGVLPYLQRASLSTGGSFTQARGEGYYACVAGVILTFLAALLSLSLWCCAAHGDENRAMHPPRLQVVEMDAMPGVEIAQAAPQPGFVRLSSDSSRFSLERAEEGGGGGADDEDDDGHLGLVTEHHHREALQSITPTDPASSSKKNIGLRVSYGDDDTKNVAAAAAAAPPFATVQRDAPSAITPAGLETEVQVASVEKALPTEQVPQPMQQPPTAAADVGGGSMPSS